jgi:hypothetical protein
MGPRWRSFPVYRCSTTEIRSKTRPSTAERSSFRYSACAQTSGIAAPVGSAETPSRPSTARPKSAREACRPRRRTSPTPRCTVPDRARRPAHSGRVLRSGSATPGPVPSRGRDRRHAAGHSRRGCTAASMGPSGGSTFSVLSITLQRIDDQRIVRAAHAVAHQFQEAGVDDSSRASNSYFSPGPRFDNLTMSFPDDLRGRTARPRGRPIRI